MRKGLGFCNQPFTLAYVYIRVNGMFTKIPLIKCLYLKKKKKRLNAKTPLKLWVKIKLTH